MNNTEKQFKDMLDSDSVSGYHAQDVSGRFYEAVLDERLALDKLTIELQECVHRATDTIANLQSEKLALIKSNEELAKLLKKSEGKRNARQEKKRTKGHS